MPEQNDLTHEGTAKPGTAPLPGVSVPVQFVRGSDGKVVTDKRWVTRKAKEKARRERLIRQRKDRIDKENAVLAIAAGGAGIEFIAKELGVSVRWARELYHSAQERVGHEDTKSFIAAMDNRHGVLLQATWGAAIQGDSDARKDAVKIMDQWIKLRGAYPAPGIDITGTVVHEHNSTHRVAVTLTSLQAQAARRRGLATEEEAVDAMDPVPTNRLMNGNRAPLSA
jgi:hypothetical protein